MGIDNLIPNSQRSPEEVRENQRRGGINSGAARRAKSERLRAWRERLGVEPLSREEANDMDACLLAMTSDQLRHFANDDIYPAEMRRRARRLLAKDDESAVDMGEKMRDRAFGKPKQTTEMDVNTLPAINIKANEIE